MSDTSFNEMKVTELRRALKARNLSSTGSKSELIARLQSASTKDEDNLYDELDFDGELDDEVEKDHDLSEYHLDSEVADVHLAPSEDASDVQISPEALALKKTSPLSPDLDKAVEDRLLSPESSTHRKPSILENKIGVVSATAKKIVLNRVISVVTAEATPELLSSVESETKIEDAPKRVKITVESDSRLEMRAKRFGLPPTDDARKEARKLRFGNGTAPLSGSFKIPQESEGDLDKLKKRAERFGASVSKVLTDLESKDRIQKRKAKFGVVGQ